MIWIYFACVTIIIELFTGTIYLLFISIAFLSTYLLYFLNISTDFDTNLIITAIFIMIAITIAYHFNKYKKNLNNDLNNINLGNIVVIEKIQKNGLLYVKYRGTIWQAQIEENTPITLNHDVIGKKAKIINENANILIIKLI